MPHKLLSLCVLAAPLALALPAGAEEKKAEPPKQAGKVEVSGPTTKMSSSLSASLTASLPKYQPPPPPAPAAKHVDPAAEETEEAEPEGTPLAEDQPKNKIIRLPRYVVEADRPPVFKEQEIYTKSALAKIAMRRYLSRFDTEVLNRYVLPIIGMSPEQRALMIYEENQRLEDMSDLKDAARGAALSGNKSESDYLRKESNRTFMRSGGMDWTTRKE